jgi:hypothetical protein
MLYRFLIGRAEIDIFNLYRVNHNRAINGFCDRIGDIKAELYPLLYNRNRCVFTENELAFNMNRPSMCLTIFWCSINVFIF